MRTTERGNSVIEYGCPVTDAPVPSALVSIRTPVFIYAADPLSAAGAKAQLMGEPSIELVGPVDLDRARVALVVADAADESVAKVARAIQRDGVPQVVLVAARFDEAGVVAAVAARASPGSSGGPEATSARLVERHPRGRPGRLPVARRVCCAGLRVSRCTPWPFGRRSSAWMCLRSKRRRSRRSGPRP